MTLREIPYLTWFFAVVLVVETALALWTQRWSVSFVSGLALALVFLPVFFQRRFQVRLPPGMFAVISAFIFMTLYLGEQHDFYERFWWWDVVLHGGSAIALGIAGFLFVFALFEGDRYAAPPIALAFISFCFAVMVGAVWEIFEFAVDQTLGTNMQKSGLVDTMADLIVDCCGAMIGAGLGFAYLKNPRFSLSRGVDRFVKLNRKLFPRGLPRPRRRPRD